MKIKNHRSYFLRKKSEGGYAALFAVIFLLLVSLTIGNSFTSLSTRGAESGRTNVYSLQAYASAESGAEDAFYRLKKNKNLPASYTFNVGSSTAEVSVSSPSSSQKSIVSTGDNQNFERNLNIEATNGIGVDFHYGLQIGDGGIEMNNSAQVIGNVYSNGSIVGGVVTGDVIVAGGISSTPSLSYEAENADYFFATTTIKRDVAQSFTANTGGKLNRVAVYLAKVGSPTSDITLRIASDNSGKPSSSTLASAILSRGIVGSSPAWINVSFDNPYTLTDGVKYWIVLDYSTNNASNYWNWRMDSTDGYANQTGKYSADYSNGVWSNASGDFNFKVWIGGVNTKIADVTVGDSSSGTATANLFEDATVHGSSCPNQYCIIDNPARKELPISDGQIQDFKDDALSGGSQGTINLSGSQTLTVGPKKITGNISLSNNAILTVSGTLWVTGDLSLSNSARVVLSSGYGSNSGAIIVDGTVNVSNSAVFSGSGQSGSYVMIVGTRNAPTSNVMNISNSSSGVIYYAPYGIVSLSNSAGAKEISAYGIEMSNSSSVTYESGLADVNFALGPSGAWEASSWREQ